MEEKLISKEESLESLPKKHILQRIIVWGITFILIAVAIVLGVVLFKDRKWNLISIIIAFACCIPFFLRFEKKRSTARELLVIATMTAITVIGRLIFAALPGFKPVTALVVITAIAFGPEAGFITGSLSALVSNMFYGQGPWTPFQMATWGIIGFISGIIFYNKKFMNKKYAPAYIILTIVGIISGCLFSLCMDIWTTISFDGTFELKRYLAYIASSLPFMVEYMVSNVIFLLLLTFPLLDKLKRLRVKYGVFN